MSQAQAAVHRIEWRELFPWLILFRTFRIAIAPALLALATAAVLIAPLGWWLAGRVFLTPAERQTLQAAHTLVPRAENSQLAKSLPLAPIAYLPTVVDTALLEGYFSLSEPLSRFFRLDISLGQAAYYAFGFLWTLAIWAFPGGVVTRRAITQLAAESAAGIRSETIFAGRRYLWYLLAPLYPLLGIILLALPIAILGLIVRMAPSFGALLAGLAWLLIAVAGIAAMWLFGGLIFGWPLMWPTISAERDGDPFEAFSRSYSYVYGKPLHYFFYVVVAAAFGALCWAVVEVAAELIEYFGFWALSWGAGGAAAADLRGDALQIAAGNGGPTDTRILWRAGVWLIGLVVAIIQAGKLAFRYTFFFSVAAAIYLLLRSDVDEKEMDEVYLEDQLGAAEPEAETTSAASAVAPPPSP